MKRANAYPDGPATPSWHQKASSDRRFRRSSSADRRRLSDWNARPNRRGNSERRWGTTYRSRVGRTSEADAYSPSLGRGPEGGGVDDFRVVPRGKQPGWLGGPPLLRGRKSFVKQDFFFRNQPFAVHNTPPSAEPSLLNGCAFLNICTLSPNGDCLRLHSRAVNRPIGPMPVRDPK